MLMLKCRDADAFASHRFMFGLQVKIRVRVYINIS